MRVTPFSKVPGYYIQGLAVGDRRGMVGKEHLLMLPHYPPLLLRHMLSPPNIFFYLLHN